MTLIYIGSRQDFLEGNFHKLCELAEEKKRLLAHKRKLEKDLENIPNKIKKIDERSEDISTRMKGFYYE